MELTENNLNVELMSQEMAIFRHQIDRAALKLSIAASNRTEIRFASLIDSKHAA
jgi:hypothetical protein